MTWIKRNLIFLISIVVAVALIGVGGYFYLYQQFLREQELRGKIKDSFGELKKLASRNPHPGDPRGTDNVAAARSQVATATDLAKKLTESFKPIPRPAITGNFSRALDQTLAGMRSDAAQSGVALPAPGYAFTFTAENKMLNLPSQSLPQIAGDLSEIKTICDILFEAKVNSLDSIERPVIPGLETNGPEFIPGETNVNTLADLSPYRVKFRCFSGELATVLGGLASSPYGLIVKYIDVDPGAVNTGRVPPPRTADRPVQYLNENLFQVTLMIDVVKPKPIK